MEMYDEIIERLKAEAQRMGSREALRSVVKATKASFHNTLNGKSGPNARTFMEWLERLDARVIFPGDPTPGEPKDVSLLHEEIKVLKDALRVKEIDNIKLQGRLDEARENVIRLENEKKANSVSECAFSSGEKQQGAA